MKFVECRGDYFAYQDDFDEQEMCETCQPSTRAAYILAAYDENARETAEADLQLLVKLNRANGEVDTTP